jgi:glucuronoarabinoxylan endo-1,4-beta-xylanase
MNRIFIYGGLVLSFSVVHSFGAVAQIFVINGVVSAAAAPVQRACVTFVDNSDTARKFSAITDNSGRYQLSIGTASVMPDNELPASFELEQNYPNPFASSTTISYKLNKQADVKVTIYDILGRRINSFSIGIQAAGAYGIVWNGRNALGKMVSPGVYFYRLQARGKMQVKKMIFGLGGKNAPISIPSTFSPEISKKEANVNAGVLGRNFSIWVRNTDSTSPAITPEQVGNVTLIRDTTLNFAVSFRSQAIVYPDSTRQIISGFGGVNMPGWSTVGDLSPAQVRQAYGTGDGQIGLSILRIRVPYDSTQFYLEVPTAALADSLGAAIMATPWSPPPSMKSNNNIVGGTLAPGSYAAFAEYLRSFVDYMSSHGAPLYAVSVQNEPDWNASYESCNWDATQMLSFVRNNAPAIGTRIIAPESYRFDHAMSDPLLNDSVACANLSIVGGHIYGDSALQSYALATSKGKEVWMTEHIYEGSEEIGDDYWAYVLGSALEINDCMKAGMSAYVYWCIRNFCLNGWYPEQGIALSQFSRFIRPGYTRVEATVDPSRRDIQMTAYKSGSKIIIVVFNLNSAIEQTFTIQNGTAASFTPYVTSETKKCRQGTAVTVTDGSFTAVLDPRSVTTFVSN